ncbi:MAG: mechanosensitive ion channel family protein [Blastocatellia bacterium]|nr:mechanosensitive ion channel family protein [Blastocatellia bacterium]
MGFDLSKALKGVHEMAGNFAERLPYIILALLVFVIFYVAAKAIRGVVRRIAHKRKRHRNIGVVLGRLMQWLVVFLGLLIALVIALPTFKPAQLVQFLGISSVAIGFAFRDVLQNFLAGILLLLNEPFRVGDQIKMGDLEGTVEEIETRATMIRTYDNRRIVVPNAELFTNSVTVNTAYDKRRLEYDVGIGYGDDIERARPIILEAAASAKDVVSDPAPEVLVYEYGESTVNLRVRWWIVPPRRSDALDSRDQVLSAIKSALSSNGIDLPFPTRQILFHDQTEETDGDRSRQREGWPAGNGDVPRPRSIAAAIGRSAPIEQEDVGRSENSR